LGVNERLPPKRWVARAFTAILVVALCSPAALSAVSPSQDGAKASLEAGTVTSPANGSTVVSVQGYTFQGNTNPKKPARLVSVGERGGTEWVYDSKQGTAAWFFDVDPLPNGNLLVVSPRSGETLVYELNPATRERVWEQRFPFEDTHDVDMLNDQELVISHMRAWDAANETSDDRIVVYNLTRETVTWEWYYRNHFPADTDGGMNDDWTHSNDVDPVGEDRLLLSPRNFDQVLLVNRTTREIEMRLGEDGNHSILDEQHNPDYLVSEDGTPTILVADSGNDRVVEYAYEDGEWTRTWTVGADTLRWPRDADRLPNGNTLITDTLNHRVLEVTPNGTVVWEYYATWGPYDAERVRTGDGSKGPTIRDLNASGEYAIKGSANLTAGGNETVTVRAALRKHFDDTALEAPARGLAVLWGHYAPWFRPVWLSEWDFASLLLAGLVTVGWTVTESAAAARRRWLGE
jgi:hypothetical protein